MAGLAGKKRWAAWWLLAGIAASERLNVVEIRQAV